MRDLWKSFHKIGFADDLRRQEVPGDIDANVLISLGLSQEKCLTKWDLSTLTSFLKGSNLRKMDLNLESLGIDNPVILRFQNTKHFLIRPSRDRHWFSQCQRFVWGAPMTEHRHRQKNATTPTFLVRFCIVIQRLTALYYITMDCYSNTLSSSLLSVNIV